MQSYIFFLTFQKTHIAIPKNINNHFFKKTLQNYPFFLQIQKGGAIGCPQSVINTMRINQNFTYLLFVYSYSLANFAK
jgi:hypothetical protein